METGNTNAKRFALINFLPFVLWLGFVIFNEREMWPSPAVRIAYGLTFLAAFYVISIYMILWKRLHKGLIVLLLLPPTAVIIYIVLLFIKPRGVSTMSNQAPDIASRLSNRTEAGDNK